MLTESEASKKACELLRKQFVFCNHPNIKAYDDDYIIRNYPDEWGWFMQGWQETIKYKKE